jgi:hypothetical protein
MTDFLIDLAWDRDAAGYELLPEEEGVGFTLLDGRFTHPLRIVPRGGELIRYHPMRSDPSLYATFASVRTPDDLLEFIHEYGPLTESGRNRKFGESVPDALEHAGAFRSWMSQGKSGEVDLATWAGSEGKRIGRGDIRIIRDADSGSARFQYQPQILRSALWLQLMQKLASNRPHRECLHCGKWFPVGPGTDRRIDAKFCESDHQILFNRRKQSGKGSTTNA